MASSSKYYGFIRYSDCYHSSPDCPVIKHVAKSCESAEVRAYKNESSAIASGHLRRCRLCLGDKVFAIDGGEERVHLSDEQYGVLKVVTELFDKSGAMTLKDISKKRDRSVVSTYLILKKLRKDGLVQHKLKVGGKRASGRSIAPTELGIKVMRLEALPNWDGKKKK